MGADLVEAGVNLNLAPVADVNTNPLNPVIGIRAFGAEAELVARHVAAFVWAAERRASCAPSTSRATETHPWTRTSPSRWSSSSRNGAHPRFALLSRRTSARS